jgi:Na+-transporting NADH:ubiquinone oxidoreductase subunit NqrB
MGRQTDIKVDPATLKWLHRAFLLFAVFLGALGTILLVSQGEPFYKAVAFGAMYALFLWAFYALFRRRNELVALVFTVIIWPTSFLPAFFRDKPYWQYIIGGLIVVVCGMVYLHVCFTHLEAAGKKPSVHPLADPEIDAERGRAG